MDKYLELFHWSFLAVALIIAVISEFLKRLFKTLPQTKSVKLFANARLIPALIGGLLGLIPNIPAPEVVGLAPSVGTVLYFATAGIISAWVYGLCQELFIHILPDNIKKYIENKFGTKPSEEEGDEK